MAKLSLALLALSSFASASYLQQILPAYSLDDIINASPFLSLHRDLVQIPSVSGNESAVGDFLTEYLEARDFTVVQQPVLAPGSSQPRYNIFAYPSSAGQSPPEILLTSHIDTVPPFIPYSLHRTSADILIAGRGTVDAKASVAALIYAALETLSRHPTAPLALLFVAFSANTTLNTADYHTVIFGEPTDLALVAGHKGLLGLEVVATGQAAHSGYPWLGESAVSAILPALSILDKLGDLPAADGGLPASPKYGRTTVNIGHVVAGVAANVVPASAVATVAVRLAASTPAEARAIIRAAVANATTVDNPHDVVLDFQKHAGAYPPQDLDVDVPGFPVTTVNYGTDVPNLELRGGPAVKRYLYGPGSIHVAHGDTEAIT
ncbi:hypothetical protein ARAM_006086, partial [Aspergillus rambellii]